MHSPVALRVVGPAVRGERRALAAGTGLALAGVVLDLARPWPLAFAVDRALGGDATNPTLVLVAAAGAALVLTVCFSLLDAASTIAAEQAAERIGARLRADVFEHALTLSPRWHDRTRTGELISRLTTDVGRLLDALVAVTATLLPDMLRLGLVLMLLVLLEPQLALVALAVVPLLMVLAVRQRRRVREAEGRSRQASGRLTAVATDLVRNVRAVQAFARNRRAVTHFGRHNRDVLRAASDAVSVEARWSPIADVVLAVGSGLVLVVGGRRVVTGDITTGQLLVVLSYVASLYSPVRGLSRLSGTLAKASVSAARVEDVLGCDERVVDSPDAVSLRDSIDEIRFEDVDFGYDPAVPVLTGFDLTVRRGETVALVGASGAGKSTLLSLLLRLHDVDSGRITLDGVDIRDVRTDDLRGHFAYVPQDAWLLDVGIADNIGFGAPAAARHEIVDAAATALVDEFAERLMHGLDSEVGEGGSRLSGGQRRRVALARAVVADAPVLLLDEPTAALDPAAAALLVRALRRASVGRTVLLVTHDPELAATADRVVAVDRWPATEPSSVREQREVTS